MPCTRVPKRRVLTGDQWLRRGRGQDSRLMFCIALPEGIRRLLRFSRAGRGLRFRRLPKKRSAWRGSRPGRNSGTAQIAR